MFFSQRRLGRFYIGYSGDPDQRLAVHNSGKVSATRNYRPWKKVYQESFSSEIEAIRRERYIKSMKRRAFLLGLINLSNQ